MPKHENDIEQMDDEDEEPAAGGSAPAIADVLVSEHETVLQLLAEDAFQRGLAVKDILAEPFCPNEHGITEEDRPRICEKLQALLDASAPAPAPSEAAPVQEQEVVVAVKIEGANGGGGGGGEHFGTSPLKLPVGTVTDMTVDEDNPTDVLPGDFAICAESLDEVLNMCALVRKLSPDKKVRLRKGFLRCKTVEHVNQIFPMNDMSAANVLELIDAEKAK